MKLDNEVLNVLSNCTTRGGALGLPEQLDRKLYVKVNKALEAAGFKWVRSQKAHVCFGDAFEHIDQMILTGEIMDAKQEFGYFPTPEPIVQTLCELAQLQPGLTVLEPSAGQGAIVKGIIRRGCKAYCVELLPENIGPLSLVLADNSNGEIVCADFLLMKPERLYERVVMNPPFAKQADIHHVNHALKFIKGDGLLVSVMANGVSFRDNKLTTEFRNLVDERGGNIQELPEGSFKESGTMVRSCVVVIPGA